MSVLAFLYWIEDDFVLNDLELDGLLLDTLLELEYLLDELADDELELEDEPPPLW
jgi:hypothetical protein